MSDAILAATIQAGATVAAAIGAVIIVIWQMDRQGKLSREAITNAESRRLRTSMYEDGVEAARDVIDRAIEYQSALLGIETEVTLAAHRLAAGEPFNLPTWRYPKLLEMRNQLSQAVIRMMYFIENRRIFDVRLVVFRDFLSCAMHDLGVVTDFAHQTILMQAVPTDRPDGGVFEYTPPTLDQVALLHDRVALETAPIGNIVSWMEDFLIEIQQIMIGDIFPGQSLEHRVPLDPNSKVIRLEDFDELMAWLQATPWGLHVAEVEAQVQAGFEAQALGNQGNG